MKRYFSNHRKTKPANGRTTLIGVVTIVAILSGISFYLTCERQSEKVLRSYCGDFGVGSKSLVLMKDSTFRLSYYGCSQTNGFVAGDWSMNEQIINFSTETAGEILDSEYQLKNFELIPVYNHNKGKFTLCEYYRDPWEIIAAEENSGS